MGKKYFNLILRFWYPSGYFEKNENLMDWAFEVNFSTECVHEGIEIKPDGQATLSKLYHIKGTTYSRLSVCTIQLFMIKKASKLIKNDNFDKIT